MIRGQGGLGLRRLLLSGRGKLAPVLTLLLVGFTLITLVSYVHSRRVAEQLAMGHAVQALQFLNRELDHHFSELRLDLAQWSQEEIFLLALEDSYLGRSARVAANARLADRIQDRDITRIILADAHGDILASSDPGIIGAITVGDRSFFLRSLAGKPGLESYAQGRYSPKSITILSTPVRDREARVPGILYLVLDTRQFARRLLDAIRVGQSGGAALLDPGTGVLVRPSWASSDRFALEPHQQALAAAADTGQVLRFTSNAGDVMGHGMERMAVSARNTQTGWLLVVEADTHEILRPAAWLATVNGVISLGILALAGLALAALSQALAGLRDSEARYRALIETSPLGIATFDAQGRVTYLNHRARAILGLEDADQADVAWPLDLEDEAGAPLPPSELPVARVLAADGKEHSGTAWRRARSGERRALSLNAARLAPEGQAPGVVAVMEDVTDLHQARQVLQQSKEELERLVERRTRELTAANQRLLELDELKSAFLSTVSHDLRTPLTSVLGFAKLIQREFAKRFLPWAQADPRREKSAGTILANLDIIVHEGERLTRLIADLLDFSRLDSGRYQWNDAPVDLTNLARKAAATLATAFAEKPGLRLRLEIPPQLAPLTLDADRVMQVLINLLSNALKYTHEGEVCLFVRETATGVELGVSDTGTGIAPAELDKIFDRFYQVRGSSESDKPPGAGLGLAICKQIVEHYHGRLGVSSEPDRGSIFTVELPRKRDTRQES